MPKAVRVAVLHQGHVKELGAEPAWKGKSALSQAEINPDDSNLSNGDVNAPHCARTHPVLWSEVLT